MTNKPFFNTYGKHILIWVCISTAIGVALKFGIDKKVVVFGTVVIGVFLVLIKKSLYSVR